MKLDKGWMKGSWGPYTIAICTGVLFYYLLQHLNVVGTFAVKCWNLMIPIILAMVIAYLINPLSVFYRRRLVEKLKKTKIGSRMFKGEKACNRFSVWMAILTVILVLVLLLIAIVPSIVSSSMQLFENLGTYVAALEEQLSRIDASALAAKIDLSKVTEKLSGLLQSLLGIVTSGNLLTKSQQIGGKVTTFLVAVILAIYFLLAKSTLFNGAYHILKSLMKPSVFEEFSRYVSRCNTILLRYISCSILEAGIVGVVNALFMLITRMPYVALVSVVVGVTNLAPTFGPIVGAVIGSFILILAKPIDVIGFLLFTMVLQTIDGYVIKPKLFGNTLGVSSLLILIFLIVGGKAFGIMGILLAIPLAAIFEFTVRDVMEHSRKFRQGKEDESEVPAPQQD